MPLIALAQEYEKTEINGIKYDCYYEEGKRVGCGWGKSWFLTDTTSTLHRLISIQQKNKLWIMVNYPKGADNDKNIKSSLALAEISCDKFAFRVLQYSSHSDFLWAVIRSQPHYPSETRNGFILPLEHLWKQ